MRKKWTVEDIEQIIAQLDAEYYTNVLDIAVISINSRLNRALGRVIHSTTNGVIKLERVELSKRLIDYGSEEQIMDTILHEFAHCMQIIYDNECNHGRTFKEYCDKLGCHPGATVKGKLKYWEEELADEENKRNKPKQRHSRINYRVCCDECGEYYEYKRKTNLVKLLEENKPHNYECGYCGSERLKLDEAF